MLEALRKTRVAKLIPFLMAGHPNLEMTERLALSLIEEGVAALELGVPFSDALADGPVIQRAAEKALQHNVCLEQVLDLAGRLHQAHPKIPLIIFSYLNPILSFGIEKYVAKAKICGVAATLAVDLPPEEAEEFFELHRQAGLQTVFLASPTTSSERLPLIDRFSTGFIYVVSRTGVTGIQNDISQTLGLEIDRIRKVSRLPLAVGFGISNAEQAQAVARFADAVVVGSAFVKLIEAHSENPTCLEEAVRGLARDLLRGLSAAAE